MVLLTAEQELNAIRDLLGTLSEQEQADLVEKLRHVKDETIEHPDAAKTLLTRFNEECETQEQEDERQRKQLRERLEQRQKMRAAKLAAAKEAEQKTESMKEKQQREMAELRSQQTAATEILPELVALEHAAQLPEKHNELTKEVTAVLTKLDDGAKSKEVLYQGEAYQGEAYMCFVF